MSSDSITERLDLIASELSSINAGLKKAVKDRDRGVLVSCKEAARLLGKSTKTVSAMVCDGRLKKITIGESTGIRLSDIWEIKAS